MADWLFDGANRLIIEPAGSGNTSFDVERDLYSAWKRWVVSSGSGFLPAFRVEGGTPIGATGIFSGKTIILINGWKLRAAAHDHQVTLTGNLFSDDGVIATPGTGNATIFINSSAAAQGISTGGVVTSQNITDITNAVFSEIVEAGETLRDQLRLLRANAAGNISDDGQQYTISSADGLTDRITGTYTEISRTITTDTT